MHPDAGNFGGFPNPVARLTSALLARRTTLTRTTTFASVHAGGELVASKTAGAKLMSYLTFDAEVGRNSNFHKLTSEQEEELGGVEYRVRERGSRGVAMLTFAERRRCPFSCASSSATGSACSSWPF